MRPVASLGRTGVVMVVVALALAACGGGDDSQSADTTATTSGSSEPVPTAPRATTTTVVDAPSTTAAHTPATTAPVATAPAVTTTTRAPAPTPAAPPAATSVSIVDFAYAPTAIQVKVGQTINWSNDGNVVHTVTSSSAGFDSGTLMAGGGFSFTPSAAGTINYRCLFHSQMQGTITVVA